jgi:lipid-binding SYLF domain-containing protein
MRNIRWGYALSAFVLLCLLVLTASAGDDKKENEKKKQDQKTAILKMKDEALADLGKAKPEAAAQLKKAPGYAIFDNTGVHLLLLASVRGEGVAVAGGKPVYMKMKTVGAGIGAGVKDYRLIFVFKNAQAYKKFINAGWDFGGEADAAAKNKESGGASSGTSYSSPDMDVYTITKKGLALQATLGGTKFSRNSDLND